MRKSQFKPKNFETEDPGVIPFKQLTDGFPTSVFFFHITPDMKIIADDYQGPVVEDVTGAGSQLRGKELSHIFNKLQYDYLIPHFKCVYKGEQSNYINEFIENQWYYTSLTPYKSEKRIVYGVGISINITEMVLIDKSFKEAQNIAHMGLWKLDVTSQTFTWSSEILRMFEVDDKVNQLTLMQFINYIDKENVKEVISEINNLVEKCIPVSFIFSILTKGGTRKHFKFIGKPHKIKDGKVVEALGFIQDKTSIYAYQIELEHKTEEIRAQIETLSKANAELQKAKQRAEESNQLKSAFLENLSHEIRTPLNGIVGFSELITKEDIDHESRLGYANIIRESSQQLLAIINNIIDVSKIESGQVDKHYSRTNIAAIFERLATSYQSKCEKKGLLFEVQDSFPNHETYIMTDPVKFRQILDNLLKNAIKFTSEGEITFGNKVLDTSIEFFVKDTGIGIKKEDQKKIYDRFVQLGNSAKNEMTGTGLGLTIAKAYTQILGGELFLSSKPGKGSTFTLKLPTQPYFNTHSTDQESMAIPQFSNKKILVVEDEEINYLFFRELLLPYGLKCISAKSGEEAIDICKTTSDISLILMDIKMPGMNGFEATKAIKEAHAHIPVIAQTAYAMEESRFKSMEVGCDEFLTKPIDTELLLKKISKYLNS